MKKTIVTILTATTYLVQMAETDEEISAYIQTMLFKLRKELLKNDKSSV